MSLRSLRKDAGLTLQQLAELSGLHYVKLCQIETGKINPENITLKTALKISRALHCRPERLLETEEQNNDI